MVAFSNFKRYLANTYRKMKKIFFILASVILLFSSCRTQEKVLYFQDVVNQETIATQTSTDIRFEPGDKMSIVVSSAKPELAAPFNLSMVNSQAGATSRTGSNQISLYTIDNEGCVDIPVLGKIKIGELTRTEAVEKIQNTLRERGLLTDAVVTINIYELYITILGEVKNPRKVNITKDKITILEALAEAGDLTIHARRDRILVLRKEGNETMPYYVDIRSKDIMNSPVYYLSQNDVVYVEPNKVRTGQSTVNDNNVRAISTWLSISSFLVTLGVLIFK